MERFYFFVSLERLIFILKDNFLNVLGENGGKTSFTKDKNYYTSSKCRNIRIPCRIEFKRGVIKDTSSPIIHLANIRRNIEKVDIIYNDRYNLPEYTPEFILFLLKELNFNRFFDTVEKEKREDLRFLVKNMPTVLAFIKSYLYFTYSIKCDIVDR